MLIEKRGDGGELWGLWSQTGASEASHL